MTIKQYVSLITVNSDLIKPSDIKQHFQRYIKELQAIPLQHFCPQRTKHRKSNIIAPGKFNRHDSNIVADRVHI
jgi:hypothetical protein